MNLSVGRVLAAPYALGFVLCAAAASAQTLGTTTGAISGAVTDVTGAMLPEVSVAVMGEALMMPRTTVTGDDGQYRIPMIPPGTYSVVFSRDGFHTAKAEGVFVGAGVSVTVPAVLGPATVQQSEHVSARSSVLDRQTTAIATTFTADQLASLPNSQTVFAILSATPGVEVARVEVGGASGDAAAPYAAYGTLGSNRPTIEGISVSAMFPLGFTLDYRAFEQATVYTAAHGAEWSAPGVHMQLISKSGSNRYRGTLYGDYEHRTWQAFNVDADQAARSAAGRIPAREANRVWSYHDTRADLGGFVVPDRVWWFGSVRHQTIATRQVNFPIAPLRTQLTNVSAKVNARVSADQTLIAYAHIGRNHRPTRLDPFGAGGLTAASALNQSIADTVDQRALGWVWKGEWNAIVGDSFFLEARAGEFGATRPERPNGHAPRYEDVVNSEVRGGNRDWQQNSRRQQIDGSATFFWDGGRGRHQIKAGGELARWIVSETWNRSYPGDVLHVLQGGAPAFVYLFQTPSRSVSGLWIASGYVSDAWQVAKGLTLHLGVRVERYRAFLPRQFHPAGRFNLETQTFPAVKNLIAWNEVVPRLGATLDLRGDGRMIAKLVYGRYAIWPSMTLIANANPNPTAWWHLFPWSDANRNLAWDPGEENRAVEVDSRGGLEKIDSALELSSQREAGGWIERELPGRVRLKSGLLWRSENNHYLRQNIHTPFEAFSRPALLDDPGPDGQEGTSDDGPAIEAYELAPEFLAPGQEFRVQNVPGADSRFLTWDLTMERRASGRWPLVSAGASVTWYGDHAAAYSGQRVRQNQYPITPNDLINTGSGGRHEFTMWTVKVHASYDAAWGLRLTPHVRHQSGHPFGRTIAKRLNYGTVRILAEPIGTRRMDNITVVDARVEKAWRRSGRKIAVFLDVFNLLNTNAEQNMSWASDTFLRPLEIIPPRIARIGAHIDW